MDAINNIISIFEYFSTELNDEKTNFKNSNIWDNLGLALKRIYRIEVLLENIKLEKKPQQFPLEYKVTSFCDIQSTGYKISNVLEVKFNKFYPNIICRLHDEGIMDLDLNHEAYYFLVRNHNSISPLLTPDAKKCLNIYINYFFGKKLSNNERNMVTGRGYLISEHFSKYKNWIYSDTDTFFIKNDIGLIDRLETELDILELPYEINIINEIVIFERKKYVLVDSNGLGKIVGFKNK